MGESVAALALVLLLATAAPAQDRAEHLIPSLTNSATLTAVWSEQVAYPGCGFTGWQNVPDGLETNATLVFALEAAWTNARATFAVPIEPNGTDTTATGAWRSLFYRLAQ